MQNNSENEGVNAAWKRMAGTHRYDLEWKKPETKDHGVCRSVSIKFESWQSWTPISGHDGMTDQIDPPTSSNQKKQTKYKI